MNKTPTPSRSHLMARIRHNIPLYLMFLPGAVYLLVNNYIPMAGLIIAFKQVNWNKGILASPWVGLSNFEYLFTTSDAWIITRNTLGYNLVFIVLGTIIAIAVAILLNEIRSMTLKKTYQTVILLPYLISMVVVSYLVYALLSSENGFINLSILEPLGLDTISWYTEPKYWPVILTVTYIWKTFGYNCILYYATLVGIDRGYYEAAVIDGANRWQQVWNITLPELVPTIITLTLMSIGKIFYSDFGLFWQVTQGVPNSLYNVASTFDTYIFQAIQSQVSVGQTAAAGLFQAACCCITILLTNFIVSKIDEDSAII